jgi:hypothetical protein
MCHCEERGSLVLATKQPQSMGIDMTFDVGFAVLYSGEHTP